MNKAVLNRRIQVLEQALIKLNKAHNNIINDINKNIRCKECKKVMVEHAKREKARWNRLKASLLGAIAPIDYSAHPEKLFEEE